MCKYIPKYKNVGQGIQLMITNDILHFNRDIFAVS